MFLVLVGLLAISGHSADIALFLTSNDEIASADLTPDSICMDASSNSLHAKLGPYVYSQAVFFMASRQNLHVMFSNTSRITNLDGVELAQNSSALFRFPIPTLLQDSDGSNVSDTQMYWTGAADNSGYVAGANCGDFTNNATGIVGKFGSLNGTLQSCNTPHPFLCAASNVSFPRLPDPPPATNKTVYLFATKPRTATIGDVDPDITCFNESTSSPKLSGLPATSFQALAYSARRQSLLPMFAGVDEIRDLDDNIIASDAMQFLSGPLSRAALRRAASDAKLDVEEEFWTGADTTGAGRTCGDFKGGSSQSGAVGRLNMGLTSGLQRCSTEHSFVCAVNTALPPIPPLSGKVAYLFPTLGGYQGDVMNPDQVCYNATINYNNSNLANASDVYALGFFNNRISLHPMFDGVMSIRDVNNNVIASNALQLFRVPMSRMALAGPGTTLDIDTEFWTGAGHANGTLISVNTCLNFTSASSIENSSTGSMIGGLSALVRTCDRSIQLVCVAIVQYPVPPGECQPNTTVTCAIKGPGGTTVIIPPNAGFNSTGNFSVEVFPQNNATVSIIVRILFLGPDGPQHVVNLTTPVIIRIPLIPVVWDVVKVCLGDTAGFKTVLPECKYFDEVAGVWASEGCLRTNLTETEIECSCFHLTDFAAVLPSYNTIPVDAPLELTPNNIAAYPTGLISVMVVLAIFGGVFTLACHRDRKETRDDLKDSKQAKWDQHLADRLTGKKRTLWKELKVHFQLRHTWFALIDRKSGTSFQSVDRACVAMVTVFASMSMSARFHGLNHDFFRRSEVILFSVLACLLPAYALAQLFVRTGPMGFYEEWEMSVGIRHPSKIKCLNYRFPSCWRWVWIAASVLCTLGMIVYILAISLTFDRIPEFYCLGNNASMWVTNWLTSYAIAVLLVEPLKICAVVGASIFQGQLALPLLSSHSANSNMGTSKSDIDLPKAG